MTLPNISEYKSRWGPVRGGDTVRDLAVWAAMTLPGISEYKWGWAASPHAGWPWNGGTARRLLAPVRPGAVGQTPGRCSPPFRAAITLPEISEYK